MRVTNAMLSNNMMLGLNKNMNHLNTLYDQMNSLKKIQRPSDDPIILGRSLKLRLNVLETEQYKVNVSEARSWMEISEGSIDNVHGILNDIRKESSQAANGTLNTEDRHKVMTTIEQLKKQLVQESNANYAGRNVFAGYKTDQKVLFDKKMDMNPAAEFKQEFGKDKIETVTYREEEYYRIRTPYGNVDITDADPDNMEKADITGLPAGVEYKVVESTDLHPGAADGKSYYYPDEGQAYFMKDTGELILNKEDQKNVEKITIKYRKTSFEEGEPNPEVFFNSTPGADPETDSPIYSSKKDTQKLEYEIGIGTKMDINVSGKDLFDPYSLRDIDELVHVLGSYEDVEADINDKKDVDGKPIRHYKETISLTKMFSGGIGKMDKALKSASSQQADLGSRMKRLELTEKRLGDDEISYTELLSKTEDVELERAFIDFNTQYAVYQSALQVTAKVVQPTLMDFLR